MLGELPKDKSNDRHHKAFGEREVLNTGELRGRFLTLGNSKFWIPFKFERLSNFCYHCGKIKHALKVCDKRDRGNASLEGFSQQYGAWLRASLKTPSSVAPQTNKESEYGKGSMHTQSKEMVANNKEKVGYGEL